MSTRSGIVLSFVLTAILSALVFGLLSFLEARKSLREAAFEELTAIRTARIDQVELYFESVFDEANVITENPLIAEGVRTFTRAYNAIETGEAAVDFDAATDNLRDYYNRQVLPEITEQLGDGVANWAGYGLKAPTARYLQNIYLAENTNTRDQYDRLVDTSGTTAYERAHAQYHDEFKFIVDEFEYYDLFLIDHKTGTVVYTVKKEADFVSNIYTGPYRGSRLGAVVDKVKNDPSQGAVYMSDFEFYIPSKGKPAIFVASGIYENDALQGILAIQLTIDDLNTIMTSGGNWASTGLKETGETYIVGSDKLLRNESRFVVEDFDGYIAAIREADTPEDEIEAIIASESAILRQKVDTLGVSEALTGRTDTKVIDDYRGVPVLSAYAPLRIKEHDFALLAEMDAAEAFEPVRDLLLRIAITSAIFIPFIALIGLWVASMLVRPLREIRQTAQDFATGNEDVSFNDSVKNEWGLLGQEMNGVLEISRQRLSEAETARNDVQTMTQQLMPAAIGERFLQGERKVVSAEGQASAAVILFSVDPALNNLDAPQLSRDLYDDLDDRLDEIARREGVDILNQAGLQYVPFCGLTSPIKNHAERLFRFCLAAHRAIEAFNAEHGTQFETRIGFATGMMFGALIGNTAMAYEIWGEVVHEAYDLAHATPAGGLTLSVTAYDLIHPDVKLRKVKIDRVDGTSETAMRLSDLSGS